MNENNQEPKKIELLKQLISELDDLQQVEINERAFQFNRWLERICPLVSQHFDSPKAREISKRKISSENIDRIHIVDQTRNTLAMMAIRDSRNYLESVLDEVAKQESTIPQKDNSRQVLDEKLNASVEAERGNSQEASASSTVPVRHILPSTETVKDPRIVFVVHGRNLEARASLFRFLRSIGLSPLEWSQAIQETGKATPFIGEVLNIAFSKAQAVVVLLTPDDEARLREPFRSTNDPSYESQLTGQARPNVLFEAGMAMGRNPDRTIIVEIGSVRPFSDIAGRHTVRLNNNSAARQELAQRLETAGCPINLTGKDWHTEGNFEIILPELAKGT